MGRVDTRSITPSLSLSLSVCVCVCVYSPVLMSHGGVGGI